MKTVAEIALGFLGRGGKQLRPRLCRIVHGGLAGASAGGAAPGFAGVCEAVECFHKASLIHDDIQDGSPERYGAPAVHVEFGVPLAIAAGDWLVARGYRLLVDSGFDSARMIGACVRSHEELCEGQGDELTLRARLAEGYAPSRDEIVSIYRRKTGEAFALAAELGAIAASGDDAVALAARGFGLAFGVAFQVRDDLADSEGVLSAGDAAAALDEAFAAVAGHPALAAALRRFVQEIGFAK